MADRDRYDLKAEALSDIYDPDKRAVAIARFGRESAAASRKEAFEEAAGIIDRAQFDVARAAEAKP